MGRLIDAEKCPCKTCGISYCHENCKKYYEWLNGCDYDVEKVVAEINKESAWYRGFLRIHTEEAIEIVREGGV